MNSLPAQQKLIASLIATLRRNSGASQVRLIETHISWVLLAGEFAYKIKKAVNLGFLDFTTLDARRFYCAEELRLNRRLAPQLYLDTLPIGGSPEHPAPGQNPAIEYAVKMRRFAPDNLFDKLLAKERVTPRHIDELAALLASFHHSLPPATGDSPYGTPETIRANALQNFEQTRSLLTDAADQQQLAAVEALTRAEYALHEKHFAARRAQGYIRECHGDLHLGNIALIGGHPVPFDGIEFNPEFRWQDINSEIAFPVMDLLQHRKQALAFRLLNGWLEAGGDYEGIALLRFYLAYRAMVRAKIDAIRASQPGLTAHTRQRTQEACRDYMQLAGYCLTRRQPALILTHGLPGSGKTTFAQQALETLPAIRIRSDVERKRLHGLSPLDDSRTGPDIYSQEATRRTYDRLQTLARIVLKAGFTVIVDAAFLRREERQAFHQLAREMQAPFAIASLQASDTVLRARVAKREAGKRDASEADHKVLRLLQTVQEPLDAQEMDYTVEFRNSKRGFAQAQWNALGKLTGL